MMAEAASIREANRVFNKPHCRGDPQLAYKVLGLNSTPAVRVRVIPNWTFIVNHVNAIFGRINPPQVRGLNKFDQATLRYKAAISVRKVVDAILAIGTFDHEDWWDADSWEKCGTPSRQNHLWILKTCEWKLMIAALQYRNLSTNKLVYGSCNRWSGIDTANPLCSVGEICTNCAS